MYQNNCKDHDMEERRINAGSSCLLVKDDSLYEGPKATLYDWLKKEGFIAAGCYGYSNNINWIFINITSKVFVHGKHGIGFAPVICNHAITIDEFKQIYYIYKKYEGLGTLQMTPES